MDAETPKNTEETRDSGRPRRRGGQPGNSNALGSSGPVGNQNALSHGVSGLLGRGRMPRDAHDDRKRLKAVEDHLYSAVLANDGEISLFHGAVIQTALRHEGRARLLNRWLVREPGLSVAERVQILQA